MERSKLSASPIENSMLIRDLGAIFGPKQASEKEGIDKGWYYVICLPFAFMFTYTCHSFMLQTIVESNQSKRMALDLVSNVSVSTIK